MLKCRRQKWSHTKIHCYGNNNSLSFLYVIVHHDCHLATTTDSWARNEINQVHRHDSPIQIIVCKYILHFGTNSSHKKGNFKAIPWILGRYGALLRVQFFLSTFKVFTFSGYLMNLYTQWIFVKIKTRGCKNEWPHKWIMRLDIITMLFILEITQAPTHIQFMIPYN